jgi:hypothetical protein
MTGRFDISCPSLFLTAPLPIATEELWESLSGGGVLSKIHVETESPMKKY